MTPNSGRVFILYREANVFLCVIKKTKLTDSYWHQNKSLYINMDNLGVKRGKKWQKLAVKTRLRRQNEKKKKQL